MLPPSVRFTVNPANLLLLLLLVLLELVRVCIALHRACEILAALPVAQTANSPLLLLLLQRPALLLIMHQRLPLPAAAAALALPLGAMNDMGTLPGGFIGAPPCLRGAPLGLELRAVERLLRPLGGVTVWRVIERSGRRVSRVRIRHLGCTVGCLDQRPERGGGGWG